MPQENFFLQNRGRRAQLQPLLSPGTLRGLWSREKLFFLNKKKPKPTPNQPTCAGAASKDTARQLSLIFQKIKNSAWRSWEFMGSCRGQGGLRAAPSPGKGIWERFGVSAGIGVGTGPCISQLWEGVLGIPGEVWGLCRNWGWHRSLPKCPQGRHSSTSSASLSPSSHSGRDLGPAVPAPAPSSPPSPAQSRNPGLGELT